MTDKRRWFTRFQLFNTIILWGLALVVGLATGAGVWLLKRLIDLTHLVIASHEGRFQNQLCLLPSVT